MNLRAHSTWVRRISSPVHYHSANSPFQLLKYSIPPPDLARGWRNFFLVTPLDSLASPISPSPGPAGML